jgi:hypothetical protein
MQRGYCRLCLFITRPGNMAFTMAIAANHFCRVQIDDLPNRGIPI